MKPIQSLINYISLLVSCFSLDNVLQRADFRDCCLNNVICSCICLFLLGSLCGLITCLETDIYPLSHLVVVLYVFYKHSTQAYSSFSICDNYILFICLCGLFLKTFALGLVFCHELVSRRVDNVLFSQHQLHFFYNGYMCISNVRICAFHLVCSCIYMFQT